MKIAGRENPNSPDRLGTEPSPWGGMQEAPSLNHLGWKVRKYPAVGEVFFLTFPFIELHRPYPILHGRSALEDSFRMADHPTRTQGDSNKSRRIGKMLATITNPFGPSA